MKKRYKNQTVRYRNDNDILTVSANDIEKIIGADISENNFVGFEEIVALVETSNYKKKSSLVKWLYCEVANNPQQAFEKQNEKARKVQEQLERIAQKIDYMKLSGKPYFGEVQDFPVPLDDELTFWGTEKGHSDYTTIDGEKHNVREYYEKTRGVDPIDYPDEANYYFDLLRK